MSFDDKAGPIAPPVTACPASTLIEKFVVTLQGGLDLAFGVVLNPGLPLVGDQPSRDKVIIVSIELVGEPTLSLETIHEQGALQDLGPECTGTSGHA
jgi:hypothetical protein